MGKPDDSRVRFEVRFRNGQRRVEGDATLRVRVSPDQEIHAHGHVRVLPRLDVLRLRSRRIEQGDAQQQGACEGLVPSIGNVLAHPAFFLQDV
jgi:hypothetical protein